MSPILQAAEVQLPVLHRAVRFAPSRHLTLHERMLSCFTLVERDAETRPIDGSAGPGAKIRQSVEHVVPPRRSACVFPKGDIRRRDAEVEAHLLEEGTTRAVRHNLEIVGLAGCGDLARLRYAAGKGEIDAKIVGESLFDQRAKLPLAVEVFAGGDWRGDAVSDPAIGGGILGPNRILDEQETVVGNGCEKLDAPCGGKALVHINGDVDVDPPTWA